MTTTKRAKRPRISSPLAPLTGYTNIKEPDTKFDPNGTFKARILLDPDNVPEHASYLEELENLYAAHIEATKKETGKKKVKLTDDCRPWGPQEDEDGEETGKIIVRFKLTAHVETKSGKTFDQKPKIFEMGNKSPLVGDALPNVGSGSEVQISSEVNTWNTNIGCGMTLWLTALMIHKLVEFGGAADAKDFGFDVGDCSAEEFTSTEGSDSGDDGDY